MLVVGGSSGLGFRLASVLSSENKVIITGRKDPEKKELEFLRLDLTARSLPESLDGLVSKLPDIDLLIYAAGSYARGLLPLMHDQRIREMHTVYLLAPTLLMSRILWKQRRLPGFIAISSISQSRPNAFEPVYCSLKAGFGMFANCLSLDPNIGKVLVASPARINGSGKGSAWQGEQGQLDPDWVTATILSEYEDDFGYKLVEITRNPATVTVKELRKN